jgi:hypothetical protein
LADEYALGDIKSEAAALRALLQAGAEALHDGVLDAGYARLADEFRPHEYGGRPWASRGL